MNTSILNAANDPGCHVIVSRRKFIPTALFFLSTAAFCVLPAHAQPIGGSVSVGTGTIDQTVLNTTTVNQTSQNLAINWTSFDIASTESVNFIQPSTSSIALNRIVGGSPTSILGSLNANGQVFVLNPSGVLFGTTAQVNVGGLVASTLSLSDADFIAGNSTGNYDAP